MSSQLSCRSRFGVFAASVDQIPATNAELKVDEDHARTNERQ